MQHWIDRSAIAHRPMLQTYSGPQLGVGNGAPTAMPPPSPQPSENDQALIVSATLYETGLFGVADRLVEVRARQDRHHDRRSRLAARNTGS